MTLGFRDRLDTLVKQHRARLIQEEAFKARYEKLLVTTIHPILQAVLDNEYLSGLGVKIEADRIRDVEVSLPIGVWPRIKLGACTFYYIPDTANLRIIRCCNIKSEHRKVTLHPDRFSRDEEEAAVIEFLGSALRVC